jgi:hypothetical protein
MAAVLWRREFVSDEAAEAAAVCDLAHWAREREKRVPAPQQVREVRYGSDCPRPPGAVKRP